MESDEFSGESVGGVANLTPFPKGVSGNPSGKPKGIRNRSTIVREALEAIIGEGDSKQQVVDMLTAAIIRKAAQGDVPAYKELLDSGYGKLTEKQEVAMDAVVSRITRTVVDPKADDNA